MTKTIQGVEIPASITPQFVSDLMAWWEGRFVDVSFDVGMDPTISPYLCDCVSYLEESIDSQYDSIIVEDWYNLLRELRLGTGFGVFGDANLQGSKMTHLASIHDPIDTETLRRKQFLTELLEALL